MVHVNADVYDENSCRCTSYMYTTVFISGNYRWMQNCVCLLSVDIYFIKQKSIYEFMMSQ